MHGAANHRELTADTERARPVEATPRKLGAHARNAGERTIERAVDDPEPLPAQRLDGQSVREPRSEPEHAFHRRLGGAGDRHAATHREPEQQSALGSGRSDPGAGIVDALVQMRHDFVR